MHRSDPNSPTESVDRPTFPNVTVSQDSNTRGFGKEDRGAVAVASPRNATIVSFPVQSDAGISGLQEEEEWEIKRIVGKRWAGETYEYKVRWKDSWLSKRALGNAQRLLKEFKARNKAQRGPKQSKSKRRRKDE